MANNIHLDIFNANIELHREIQKMSITKNMRGDLMKKVNGKIVNRRFYWTFALNR